MSLAASRDLVNDIILKPMLDDYVGSWLLPDETGEFPLPVWVDHVGSKGNCVEAIQFKAEGS